MPSGGSQLTSETLPIIEDRGVVRGLLNTGETSGEFQFSGARILSL